MDPGSGGRRPIGAPDTSGVEILSYSKPKSFVKSIERSGPVLHYAWEFDGAVLLSHRTWYGDGDSARIYKGHRVDRKKDGAIEITVSKWDGDEYRDSREVSEIESLVLRDTEAVIWSRYIAGENSRGTHFPRLDRKSTCPYCEGYLLLHAPPKGHRHGEDKPTLLSDQFLSCGNCGWWMAQCECSIGRCNLGGRMIQAIDCWCRAFGSLRSYAVESSSVPLDALRSWLRRHPNDLAHVEPRVFERLVAACFRDVYQDVEVIHVGRSKDRGIDIMFVRNDAIEALIQVKRRRDLGSTEGVGVVRTLNGVLLRQGVARGLVVTTAKQFSMDAKREATSTPLSLATYSVGLLAFDDVMRLLNCSTSYWSRPVEQIRGYLRSHWLYQTLAEAKGSGPNAGHQANG